MTATDTIFGIATGAARGAIAIVRISGPQTAHLVQRLAGAVPPPRVATLRRLRAQGGDVLDHALVLWFPGPASYTGEDMAELHLHGGQAVIDSILAELLASGSGPAAPGDFTRRAFLNGRLDLLQAEAINDLARAETDAQRRLALRQLGGTASTQLETWTAELREALAWQEALIDFPDETQPDSIEAALRDRGAQLARTFAVAAEQALAGDRLRRGLTIAIVGPPNVGKSTLLNRITGREAAITSPTPGTTRDLVEVSLEIAGVPCTLVDTAGLRDASDAIEAEGIRRARVRATEADLVIEVGDAPIGVWTWPGAIRVLNKADLFDSPPHDALAISALTGVGLDALTLALERSVRYITSAGQDLALSRPRHAAALRDAAQALERAVTASEPEVRAEELRLALRALGRIGGAVDVEDVLDTIFGQFCIGK